MCSTCDDAPERVEAYGDIAGIGVMLSFIVTAFMLVMLTTGYYLVAFDPRLDPFRLQSQVGLRIQHPNPVDRGFLDVIRSIPKTLYARITRRFSIMLYLPILLPQNALYKIARTFSDISIFTGVAILISAFKAYTCDLQSYHWLLVIHMAWLATTTHTSLLSILRNYLQNHRRQLWWRFGGMLTVFIMLTVAIIITSNFAWHNAKTAAAYAKCSSTEGGSRRSSKRTLESKVKLLMFIIPGSAVRVLKLFKSFDNGSRRFSVVLRERVARIQNGSTGGRKGWDPRRSCAIKERLKALIVDPLYIAALQIIHLHLDLCTSFLAEVVWAVVSFTWATKRLLALRVAHGPSEENEWTFGQIFPVVLLAAPLGAVVEHAWVPSKHQTAHGQVRSETPEHSPTTPDLQREEVDTGYHSNGTLQSGAVLAAVPYLHLAIYVLILDSVGISDALGHLAFSFFFFHSTVQSTWLLYALWLPKLGLKKHRQNAVLGIIFLGLLTISITQMVEQLVIARTAAWNESMDPGILGTSDTILTQSINSPIIFGSATVGMLFTTYLIFLAWFVVDFEIRQLAVRRQNTPSAAQIRFARIVGSFLTWLSGVIPVTMAATTSIREPMVAMRYFFRAVAIFTGITIAYQAIVQLVEFKIRDLGHTHQRLARCMLFVLILALCAVAVWGVSRNGFSEGGLKRNLEASFFFKTFIALLALVLTCPFWVALWTCTEQLQIVGGTASGVES